MSPAQTEYMNIPNAVSFLALLFACTAIALLIGQSFYFSFATILLAFLMDALDGFLARKLKCESEFGRQLDGFIDLVTYILYPALSYYIFFRLQTPAASLVIFVFVACGIFRLARFNVLGFVTSKARPGSVSYLGLPVYFNHLFLLAVIGCHAFVSSCFAYLACALILANSFLMISKIPFGKPRRILPYALLLLLISGLFYYLGYANY